MGGNAIPRVSRINQENVAATMEKIYKNLLPMLNLNQDDTASLGSTGKKLPGGSSGDVDLAISLQSLMTNNDLNDPKEVFPLLVSVAQELEIPYNHLKGLDIVSVGWPIENIDGNQEGEIVQLDLMPTKNIKMTAWGMSSPSESEEKYKGGVRNELLYWIANEADYKLIKQEADALGNMYDSEFERNIFDTMNGLMRLKQSFYSPKTGKLNKNKKTIWRKLVNDNPDEITALLLGPEYKSEDIMTTSATFKAMMSPSFPYKNKRDEILRKTIKGCKDKGFDYPPEFDQALENKSLNEATAMDTTRTSMMKIHQMNSTHFVQFIKALKERMEGTRLNLKDLNTSEKVDGQAFRLAVYKHNIGAESSYSGLRFTPDSFTIESFRESLRYFQDKPSKKLVQIAKDNRTWFKVIGELFYINDDNVIDDDESVTFVATKYDHKKLGKIGAFVIFDCKGIHKEEVVELDKEVKEKIIDEVASLSDANFRIFTPNTFKWDKSFDIQLNYDTDLVRSIFKDPEILLDRANSKLFKAFREEMAQAFSREIAKNGSVLGVDGTEVEGIVFEIDNNTYGATNFNWTEIKHQIYEINTEIDNTINAFYKKIFGYVQPRKILSLMDNRDSLMSYEKTYRQNLPQLKGQIDELGRQYNDNYKNIPKNVFKQQKFFVDSKINAIKQLKPSLISLKNMLTK